MMRNAALIICAQLALVSCVTSQRQLDAKTGEVGHRGLASDDHLAPVDIKASPFRNIKEINYQALIPGLNKYISKQPDRVSYQTQDERWEWAVKKAKSDKAFFSILPLKSQVSNQAILKNEALVAKIKTDRENPQYREIPYLMTRPWFAGASPAKLFAYQIGKQPSHGKPTILIWAKEHGDELAPAEFTTHLTEFFLHHLRGEGDPLVNQTVQALFARLNIVIVPDMTPNKSFKTFETGTSSVEDFNGFGVLLQPFDYDSGNPDDYLLAPEAAFLKKLILGLDHLVLGIDIHTPFGVSVITGPDESVADTNRFLIAEASLIKNCTVDLKQSPKDEPNEECSTGKFRVAHPQVSGGTANAPSYFSRMRVAPSILLELSKAIPEDFDAATSGCRGRHKELTCEYYAPIHLKEMLPYFLRLMEIEANTSHETPLPPHHLKFDFAKKDQSRGILTSDSRFFSRLSALDIELRLGRAKGASREQFMKFVSEQALEWDPDETGRLVNMMSWIDRRMADLDLDLKLPEVTFVKTTGKEEGLMPYTRGTSIILPRDTIRSQDLLFTICHELFHIYTRTHPELRPKLYALLSFKKLTGNALAGFAEKNRILTNPDVEDANYGITVQMKDQAVDVLPITLSKVANGSFPAEAPFPANVEFRLLLPSYSESRPSRIIDPSELKSSEAAASVAALATHPEELLADYFALLLTKDIKSMEHPERIHSLLQFLVKH